MDEDEALSRMRAADPAAEAEPDAERLAGLTAERRGDELATRRDRKTPRWTAVAAVAAGALVVGGAGYGLGRAGEEPAVQHEVTVAQAPAPMEERMAAPDTMATWGGGAASLVGMGGERMTFTAEGLSEEPGTAEAWAFDGAGTVTQEAAARAAEVFGVDGEPRRESGWIVGPVDGSGPTVHLMPDGAATVSYQDPELFQLDGGGVPEPLPMPMPEEGAAEPGIEPESLGDGDSGAAQGPDTPASPDEPVDGARVQDEPTFDGPAADTGEPAADADPPTDVEPAPAAPPVRVMPAPAMPGGPGDEPSAVEPDGQAPDGPAGVLYGTLAALGLDPNAAEYAAQDSWVGGEVTSVVAHQLVAGERTGHSWQAEVREGEVLSFSGPLAPLVALGEYDVVSPAEAVDRLGDPRFGASPVWSDWTVRPMDSHLRSWDDPPGAPPSAGDAIPWPVTEVTIVSAEPALTQQHTSNGSVLLLPAYELRDGDGRTWSVLAVADHELAF